MPAVEVNLNVNADASGEVSVFGQAKAPITNPVIATTTLLVTDLYNAAASGSKALFQFYEPADRSARTGKVIKAYNTDSTILSGHLNSILCAGVADSLDASGAAPFNLSAYSSETAYRKYKSFGELVLAMYAHDLFGHVQATAAIDNDATLVGLVDNNAVGTGHVRLGHNLATAIYNMDDTVNNSTAIINQVLGQDAARAMGQDNSLLAPETWQDLKWYANDIIYVSVTVKQPTVSVSNSAAATQQSKPVGTSVNERTYMVKITLADPVA